MKNLALLVTLSLVLLLSGCVGLFIAGAATTANIITDPRTSTEIWDDHYIDSEIIGIIKKPPFRNKTRITSSTFRGDVIVMGQSTDPTLLSSLKEKIRKIKGVKSVHNQVRIREPLNAAAITEDTWLTTKVKSALVTDNRLAGVKIVVVTENKEVFLLGYISHKHADIATEIARNVSGVRKVIRAFQYGD